MEKKRIIQVNEKVPFHLLVPLSLQHTFAMFGASVLVPLLFNIDPGIVLLMNGIGTLLFILISKGRSPAYLGSSFAFLGPGSIIIANMGGFTYAQGAFITTGLVGCLVAFIIYRFGTHWIDICLPPAAMGSVVALIGLELAGLTVTGKTGLANEIGAHIMENGKVVASTADLTVFLVTLGTAVIGSIAFRGFLSTIPILTAIVVGYLTALGFGQIDFTPVHEAGLFSLPAFHAPSFSMQASLTMMPALLVILSEHISHQVVTGNIIGRDLLKDPGLHRTIFADNFSTMLSGFVGGVPTTTYGENIGVMAITKVYSVYVIAGAAVISMCMAFIGPFAALIRTIPGNVIGGVTFLLYGMIGTGGIRLLVDRKVDYSKTKNLVLTSIIFVTGLSQVSIMIAGVELKGMVLACLVGIIVSLLFHLFEKLNIIHD